ncbi:MAG: M28 family peptidase [Bacteroidota bacterium]|nr:M28 family peptidase [Bacteroidota bacterium]
MRIILLFLITSFSLNAQDIDYTRSVIKFLTSKKCLGRGYVKNGQKYAADFIVKELEKSKAKPLFNSTYLQTYSHQVNTFPKKVDVKVDGKKLIPGRDFIIDPNCETIKGKWDLEKKDSINYICKDKSKACSVKLVKKLTHSVSSFHMKPAKIELLRSRFPNDIKNIELNIESVYVEDFKANNIGAFIEGQNNDSIIVFTAHYDHLGAMGKNCYFPGANDNASGTSMVLNFVKHYAATKPKYKTVFVLFSSEEIGLLGSKHFSVNSPFDLKKIKFLINLDLLGTGDDGMMVVNGAIFTKQFELLQNINKEKQLVKEIKKRGKAQNSDHYWFTELGVPSFFIYTLGGVSFYHDIDDVEKTLPLTDYKDVFTLLVEFAQKL